MAYAGAVKSDAPRCRFILAEYCTTAGGTLTAYIAAALALKSMCRIVAMGLETAGRLALLQLLGCDPCQGYCFVKPCTAEAFVLPPLAWA